MEQQLVVGRVEHSLVSMQRLHTRGNAVEAGPRSSGSVRPVKGTGSRLGRQADLRELGRLGAQHRHSRPAAVRAVVGSPARLSAPPASWLPGRNRLRTGKGPLCKGGVSVSRTLRGGGHKDLPRQGIQFSDVSTSRSPTECVGVSNECTALGPWEAGRGHEDKLACRGFRLRLSPGDFTGRRQDLPF